jgi:hypothetical protein
MCGVKLSQTKTQHPFLIDLYQDTSNPMLQMHEDRVPKRSFIEDKVQAWNNYLQSLLSHLGTYL